MGTGVRGSVVDQHSSIRADDPAVAEQNIGYISNALLANRSHEIAARASSHSPWLSKVTQIQVQYIAQASSGIAHAMGKMQPAPGSPDRGRAFAVFDLLDGVVSPAFDDHFAFDHSRVHAFGQSPANSSARASLDEIVLWAGVEGVLPIDKLRVQYHIALLV